jgi:hypothetical protein
METSLPHFYQSSNEQHGHDRTLTSKRLETEDFRQQSIEHTVPEIRIATVLVAAVVTVLIAATERRGVARMG